MSDQDQQARDEALEFARTVTVSWQEALDGRLLGLYLLGSLAHGGFNRRYSDIDLGLVAEDALDEDTLSAMRGHAARAAPAQAAKLSLFWADRDFTVGRFPPLDRVDLIEHGVVLAERERVMPPRPALSEVRDYLKGAPLANWTERAGEFAALGSLAPDNHKPYLRAHLYPARFVYSWMTGRMVSNDEAVAYLREHAPAGLDVGLVARALEIRHEAADPDAIFPDRGALPAQAAACARLVADNP